MDKRIKIDEAPADDDEHAIYIVTGERFATPAECDAAEQTSAPWPPGLPTLPLFLKSEDEGGGLEAFCEKDWQPYFDHSPVAPWEVIALARELLQLWS